MDNSSVSHFNYYILPVPPILSALYRFFFCINLFCYEAKCNTLNFSLFFQLLSHLLYLALFLHEPVEVYLIPIVGIVSD